MTFHFRAGQFPLVISIPHQGTFIPETIAAEMTEAGRSLRDTDWFLEKLYELPETRDASWIVADWSRYVIDLNRPVDDRSLYPGQATTGLVPVQCFDGSAIYLKNTPGPEEIRRRINAVWQPYHDQLARELDRLHREQGVVVLLDAHSIASEVPRLFPGKLPDFNLGTNHGQSCAADLQNAIEGVLRDMIGYTWVANGRFVGGHITRHYGRPAAGIHAIQLELSQATYLNEQASNWEPEKVRKVQPVFQKLIGVLRSWIDQQ